MVVRSSIAVIIFFIIFSYISLENFQETLLRDLEERFAFSLEESEKMEEDLCHLLGLPVPRKKGKDVRMPPQALAQYAQGVVYRNIAYGKEKKQRLDVVIPLSIRERERLPVFVFVHGGTWIGGSKDDLFYAQIAREIIQNRHVFVNLDYRLYPQASIQEMTDDVVRALHWVSQHIEEYGGNPQEVVLGGHSAGAHLVALLTVNNRSLPISLSSSIRKVVLLSGPYDLLAYEGTLDVKGEKLLELFFTNMFRGRKNLTRFSPLYQVETVSRSFFLMVGENDELTPPAQTERLYRILREKGNDAECHVLPKRGHGGVLLAINPDFDSVFAQEFSRFLSMGLDGK